MTILHVVMCWLCIMYYFFVVVRNLQQKSFHMTMLVLIGLYPIFLVFTSVFFRHACKNVAQSGPPQPVFWRQLKLGVFFYSVYVFLNNTAHIYFAIKLWTLQKKISMLTQNKDDHWWTKYCLLVGVFVVLDLLSPLAVNLYLDNPGSPIYNEKHFFFAVLCTAPQAMTSVVICHCFYQFHKMKAWNTAISKCQIAAQLLSNIVYAISTFITALLNPLLLTEFISALAINDAIQGCCTFVLLVSLVQIAIVQMRSQHYSTFEESEIGSNLGLSLSARTGSQSRLSRS